MSHREAHGADPYGLPRDELPVGGRERLDPDAERQPLLDDVVVQLPVGRVQVDGGARLPTESWDAHHVVEVRVRDPDRHGPHARLGDPAQDQARLFTGIDDDALPARLVGHEVAVLDELPVRDLDDLHEVRSWHRPRRW